MNLNDARLLKDPVSPIDFAQLVWDVSAVARSVGLHIPAFRDAPAGVVRHLRRQVGRTAAHGDNVVVVLPVRGRAEVDVMHDIVEGILAVNRNVNAQVVESFIELMGIAAQDHLRAG